MSETLDLRFRQIVPLLPPEVQAEISKLQDLILTRVAEVLQTLTDEGMPRLEAARAIPDCFLEHVTDSFSDSLQVSDEVRCNIKRFAAAYANFINSIGYKDEMRKFIRQGDDGPMPMPDKRDIQPIKINSRADFLKFKRKVLDLLTTDCSDFSEYREIASIFLALESLITEMILNGTSIKGISEKDIRTLMASCKQAMRNLLDKRQEEFEFNLEFVGSSSELWADRRTRRFFRLRTAVHFQYFFIQLKAIGEYEKATGQKHEDHEAYADLFRRSLWYLYMNLEYDPLAYYPQTAAIFDGEEALRIVCEMFGFYPPRNFEVPLH